jgi:hypothetical protein
MIYKTGCVFLLFFWALAAFSQSTSDTAYIAIITRQRLQKDSLFLSQTSPLSEKKKKDFKGLPYFEINEKYHLEAVFIKNENPRTFKMKTTTDREPLYKEYGTLQFTLDGQGFILTVYQSLDLLRKPGFKDYLFVPFTDLTSGKDTYGGGRYLDFRIPTNDKVILDFNIAYNPYCAYNDTYSCPLVPKANRLKVKIPAGEKYE